MNLLCFFVADLEGFMELGSWLRVVFSDLRVLFVILWLGGSEFVGLLLRWLVGAGICDEVFIGDVGFGVEVSSSGVLASYDGLRLHWVARVVSGGSRRQWRLSDSVAVGHETREVILPQDLCYSVLYFEVWLSHTRRSGRFSDFLFVAGRPNFSSQFVGLAGVFTRLGLQ